MGLAPRSRSPNEPLSTPGGGVASSVPSYLKPTTASSKKLKSNQYGTPNSHTLTVSTNENHGSQRGQRTKTNIGANR